MVLALQDNWATHLSVYDHLPQLVPTDPTDSLFERPPLSLTRPARSPLLVSQSEPPLRGPRNDETPQKPPNL